MAISADCEVKVFLLDDLINGYVFHSILFARAPLCPFRFPVLFRLFVISGSIVIAWASFKFFQQRFMAYKVVNCSVSLGTSV